MIDSIEIARQLFDSTFQSKLGYDSKTIPCLFIPETYQVYWDMSVDDFFQRMQKEHERFWNNERLAQGYGNRNDSGRSLHTRFNRRRRDQ